MNNDNRLRLSEAKNLFRQALQRQNDRAAGMKMPDDMEQRVMGSLQTLSNSPIKGENQRLATVPPAPEATAEEGKANSLPLRKGWGGSWRSRGVWGCIAASIALVIVLHYNTTDQPVVAEFIEPESPQLVPEPIVEEKQEPQTPQPPAQPVRLKKRVKIQEPIEEPILAEAETVEGAPVEMICRDVFGNTRELSSSYATQAQEIRQRGEQVIQYVAMLNQQIKTEQHYIEY